jgi:DNA polymerase-3 subunit gamma/tau
MAMENNRFIEKVSSVFQELNGKRLAVLCVPEEQWLTIRESFLNSHQTHDGEETEMKNEEDPLVSEAKKQFGADFIEIVD